MAKRTAKDLDAELAALEAELAALEQRKAAPKAPPPADAPAAEEPKRKLALPKLGRKAKPEPGEPEASSSRPPAAAAPAKPTAPQPAPDATLWRQEDGAWVRTVPHKPVVVRRVLDENDAVVREEPASEADLEERTPAKAERGIGRFLRRKG